MQPKIEQSSLDNTRERGIAKAPKLSKREARSLIERIHSHVKDARILILELYEKRGWKILGYTSWRECVVAEFQQSKSRVYQLLDAAKIERNLSTFVEKGSVIPEGILRPLTKLNPQQQREAWIKVTAESANPTATQVEVAVESILKRKKVASRDGQVTISLETIICAMSPEDGLHSLGHDYERQACKLIETHAHTVDEIQALITYLTIDLNLRISSIRDHFDKQ